MTKNGNVVLSEKLAADARQKTGLRVDMLRHGIAKVLTDGYFCAMEEIQPVLDLINTDLVEAVKQAEEAYQAYIPYRRMRRVTVRSRKKKAS